MFKWIKDKWSKFECWLYSWFPGAKTRTINAVGAIGLGAGVAQEYITGLPAVKWISHETVMLVSAALFTLSFWFSNMGQRVKDRE